MTTPERDNAAPSNVIPLPVRVKLGALNADQLALAAIMLGSLGILVALRKGMKGIGPIELTGSTVSGVEFAALLMLVGSGVRLTEIYTAGTPFGRALAFIY